MMAISSSGTSFLDLFELGDLSCFKVFFDLLGHPLTDPRDVLQLRLPPAISLDILGEVADDSRGLPVGTDLEWIFSLESPGCPPSFRRYLPTPCFSSFHFETLSHFLSRPFHPGQQNQPLFELLKI